MQTIQTNSLALLINQYIPKHLHEKIQSYKIQPEYIENLHELVVLVLESKSIDTNEEKQSWFDLLPLMNDQQIEKLRLILDKEKKKLQEIEIKYEQKKIAIKKKYLLKWQNMWYEKRMHNIQEKEATHREQEIDDAESLLDSI